MPLAPKQHVTFFESFVKLTEDNVPFWAQIHNIPSTHPPIYPSTIFPYSKIALLFRAISCLNASLSNSVNQPSSDPTIAPASFFLSSII